MGSSLLLARREGQAVPVVYGGRDEAGRLAAIELARYLSSMAGCRAAVLPVRPSAGPCLELLETSSAAAAGTGVPAKPGPAADGYHRKVTGSGVSLEAATGRGLLFAAYDLLEDLGCRWYYPGPVGERIPRLGEVRLPLGEKKAAPAFPGRSLILGHDLYLPDVAGWVEWAARNRLNDVFLHEFPPPVIGGRSPGYWRAALAAAVPAARRRGLILEFGGHGLAALLPRRLFGRHPDFFRHDGRRRTPDHNLCPSSRGALEVVRRNARTWLLARPGADVYHLWPDDIVGGGWCRCEECAEAGLSASDQALLATNAVADVLAEVYPRARLAFLAYHDTVEPPHRVRPRENVSLLYAPRERCYAHILDDPDCPVNRDYHARLLAGVATAGAAVPSSAQAAGPAPAGPASAGPRVFEYYLDAVLFKSVIPPLPAVMAGDLQAYEAAGVHAVGALMTSDRPHLSAPLNLWLLGRLAWDPRADLPALVGDFARGVLGDPGLGRYFADLEQAHARVVELDGQEVGLTLPGAGLLENPPRDTLDFLGGEAEAVGRKARQLREAVALVGEARGRLASSVGMALGGEQADLELATRQFDYLLARQEAVAALAAQAPTDAVRAAISRAWKAFGGILAWGRKHLPGGLDRAQFGFLHAPWELHLLKLERTAGAADDGAGAAGLAAGPTGRAAAPRRWRLRDVAVLLGIGLRLVSLRLRASGSRRSSPYHRISG